MLEKMSLIGLILSQETQGCVQTNITEKRSTSKEKENSWMYQLREKKCHRMHGGKEENTA